MSSTLAAPLGLVAPVALAGADADADVLQGQALVVDDSPVERQLITRLIERNTDLKVITAASAAEARRVLERESPLVVLTDLHMPNMDGLELVETVRTDYPSIPVILMTAQGSEEIAIMALRLGASNYIAKRNLASELPPILQQTLAVARADRRKQRVLLCQSHLDCRFELENDPGLVPLLAAHLQEHAARMGLCDGNSKIRLGVALEEAFLNGIYHGNLDVHSSLKEDGSDAFERLAAQRRGQEPYCRRRLHVHARLNRERLVIVVRDEGSGFDVAKLPDPTDPENLVKASGRGLLLIRMFVDEVTHNAQGNEITLIKRRPTS